MYCIGLYCSTSALIGLCMTQIKVRGVFSVQYEDGTVDDVHVDAIRLVEGVCAFGRKGLKHKLLLIQFVWWIDSCLPVLGVGFVIAV